MAENIESAQNGLSNSTTPPQVSIPIPKLRDTGTTLWDQQYGVSIGEAGFSQINAIFHSES